MRRDVDASALGRIIASVKVLDIGVLEDVSADGLKRALTGRALTRTDRHGKQLFFRIGRGRWLTVHLGMTGDIIFLEDGQGPPRFTRVRLDFEDGASLVYEDMRKFGAIGLTSSKSAFLERKRLGPDALEIKREEFHGTSICCIDGRSRPSCWTSPFWPGWATSTRTRRCSNAGYTPWP